MAVSILLKALEPKFAQLGISRRDRKSDRSLPPPPIANVARTARTFKSYHELFQRLVGCRSQLFPLRTLFIGLIQCSAEHS